MIINKTRGEHDAIQRLQQVPRRHQGGQRHGEQRAFAADQKRAYRQLRPHGRRRGLSAPAVPLQRLTDRGVPRPQAGAPLLCGLYGRPMLQ